MGAPVGGAPLGPMKLRTRLVLALLLLAVVPLAAASLLAWWGSERAFRRVIASEAGALAEELGGRMGEAVQELTYRLQRMRERRAADESSAFDEARRDALAAAGPAQTRELVRSVLLEVPRREGEVPFAVEDGGTVLASSEEDLGRLEGLGLAEEVRRGELSFFRAGHVVTARRDPASGYVFGIARPMGEAAAEIRSTALRNLGVGLALVAVLALGVLPLSRRITRDLEALETAAERLAAGDLEARVVVRSRDEIGRLAFAFNRMARDLAVEQERRVAEEGLRRELLACRRIQTELLPREPLRAGPSYVEGVSFPAREVGGDFFNYFTLPAGELSVIVGDVSGKGIAAALLMANVQATLRGGVPMAWDLAEFAVHLDEDLHARTPPESYLTLFLGILGDDRVLRYVNAGHNPPYLLRQGRVRERLDSTGRPLGLLPGGGYEEGRLTLAPGDALVLFTDGVLDAVNETGETFGAERLTDALEGAAGPGGPGLVLRVAETLHAFRAGSDPPDDATLVALHLDA